MALQTLCADIGGLCGALFWPLALLATRQIFVKTLTGKRLFCAYVDGFELSLLHFWRHANLCVDIDGQDVSFCAMGLFAAGRGIFGQALGRILCARCSWCLCRENWNDTEKLSMGPTLGFRTIGSVFLCFCFSFFRSSGPKVDSGPKLRSSSGSLSKLFARKPFRLCPESECV